MRLSRVDPLKQRIKVVKRLLARRFRFRRCHGSRSFHKAFWRLRYQPYKKSSSNVQAPQERYGQIPRFFHGFPTIASVLELLVNHQPQDAIAVVCDCRKFISGDSVGNHNKTNRLLIRVNGKWKWLPPLVART